MDTTINDKDRNEERRKAALRFLTSIPMDFKSVCQLHKERMRAKDGTGVGSPQHSRVLSVGQMDETQFQMQEKDEESGSVHKLPSELGKISNSGVWTQRSRHQKPAYRMKHLKPKVLHHKRLCLVNQSGNVPFSVFSVLPYKKAGKVVLSTLTNTNQLQSARRRSKRTSGSRPLSIVSNDLLFEASLSIEGVQQPEKEEEVSYKTLLEDSSTSCMKISVASELENPEWKLGSHRTVLTFPSYMVSVIDYTKPTDLKKDLNMRFRDKFPQVNITLSKCRSLKFAMQRIANGQNMDRSTAERAFAYFDRLVMSGKVIKRNRRHCAGVCLLLSAKVNSDLRSAEVSRLISGIEHGLKVGRHDLVLFEFPVFAALQFFLIYFP